MHHKIIISGNWKISLVVIMVRFNHSDLATFSNCNWESMLTLKEAPHSQNKDRFEHIGGKVLHAGGHHTRNTLGVRGLMHNVQSTTKKQIFLKPFLSFADLRQNQELVTSVSGRGIETVTALRNRLTKVKVGEPQGAEDELGEEEEWQVVDEEDAGQEDQGGGQHCCLQLGLVKAHFTRGGGSEEREDETTKTTLQLIFMLGVEEEGDSNADQDMHSQAKGMRA